MKKSTLLLLSFLIYTFPALSQNWNFKLTAKVEVRNWKLSNRAMKSGSMIPNASVELKNASGIVSQTTTDNEGNFNLSIPPNGAFTITINAPGQKPKKYLVLSKGSSDAQDANFRPVITISGMLSEKHKKDMNYIGLDRSNVKIENMNLIPRATINDGEYLLIQKFCTANKLGDMAMEKKNYDLAKTFYSMAIDMIDSEPYPKDQLKKAEEGLKLEKALAKKEHRSKKSKTKSAITNQKSGSSSKVSVNKTTVETGKATHKTRMTLGK
jgi:hypothetical protein